MLPLLSIAENVEIDGIWYNLVPKAKIAEVIRTPGVYGGLYSGDVTIPEKVNYEGEEFTVNSIGELAFNDCRWRPLSLRIPSSIKSIGRDAFNACEIENLEISDFEAFCKIDFLNELSSPLCHAEHVFLNGVETVDYVIPSSITEIKDYTFIWTTKMESITIPNSVTSIGKHAFRGCSRLTTITILNSVKMIGEFAFCECTGLTSISIPNSINNIGYCVFGGCSGLKSITIPEGVSSIGGWAFSGCIGLTSVMLPNTINSIRENAFNGCSNMTTVTFGKDIANVDDNSFKNCTEIRDVYCYAEKVPYLVDNAFENSYPEYITLHVPSGSVDEYKAAYPWSNFKDIIPLTDGDPIPTAIHNMINRNNSSEYEHFTIDGKLMNKQQKGINIIRTKNGRTKKVILK